MKTFNEYRTGTYELYETVVLCVAHSRDAFQRAGSYENKNKSVLEMLKSIPEDAALTIETAGGRQPAESGRQQAEPAAPQQMGGASAQGAVAHASSDSDVQQRKESASAETETGRTARHSLEYGRVAPTADSNWIKRPDGK